MAEKKRKEAPKQEKRGYIIAKDLKAAGPLVPQLQEAGYVKGLQGLLTLPTSCNGRIPS